MSKTNKRSENENANSPKPGSQTRREALGNVALGATGVLAFPHLAQGHTGNTAKVPKMLRLNFDQWSEFIGKTFQAQGNGTTATLKLEEVFDDDCSALEADARPTHVRQDPVSLVFSSSQPMTDENYLVRNSELGSAPMFLHTTKRGPKANKIRYQVIFN